MASPLVAEEYTEENTHFARICRTIVELCRDVLWDFLCRKYKPAKDLPGEVVTTQNFELVNHLHPKIMKLFKEHKFHNTEPTKKELDVTSLYTIIRNLIPQSVLKPPTKSWGKKMPMEKDIMEADDIERIRLYRNGLYGHITKAALSKPDYEKYKTNFRGIFSRFDGRLQGGYVQRFDDYQSCNMDPERVNYYKERLLKQKEFDEETRAMVIEVKEKQTVDSKRIDDLEEHQKQQSGEMDQIQTSNAIQEERITAVAEKQTVDSKRIDDLEEHQKQQSGEMDQIQTSNAIQEERITAVAEKQTVESKRIDDLEEHKKQQSGEMDQIQTSNAIQEERITAVAEKQTVDSKRIDDLEEHQKQQSGEIEQVNKDLKELKTSVEQKQTEESKRTSYLEERQKQQSDLQKEVIQHYQTNGYCKSAIPVLIDDEEIDIHEFYVKPTLKVKQDKNSDPDYFGSKVSSIHELFPHETIRRVCIQGEAGYGKTSFCKHLISSWCNVHSGINTEKLCERDITFLKSFELLFYIPLRNYEIADVNEMIKQEIVRENLHDIFSKVLKHKSEKCLIILDGLDEYSSSVLPNIDAKENYKVIFTSRPWTIEALRAEKHLLGREFKLTKMLRNDDLIKTVVDSLNKKERNQLDWTKFKYVEYKGDDHYNKETSQYKKIRHLAEIPVILIQMVCMWFDGEGLGTTRTEIYTSMLQYLFKVAEKYRPEAVQKYLGKQNVDILTRKSFKDLKMLNNLFSGLIFKLAHLAFHLLVSNTQGELLVFSHTDTQIFELSKEDIEFCLAFGILSQEKIQRKFTKQEKKLSFLHKTFQEFFSAIHVTFSHESVLPETLGTSVDDLFRRSEIMSFVVGISFSHISRISNHIAGVVDNDKEVLKYRTSIENADLNVGEYLIRKMLVHGADEVQRVQELLCDLIDEGHVDNAVEHPLIELRDIVIDDDTYKRVQNRLLTYLNTDSVKSFECGKSHLREPHVLRIAIGIKDLVRLHTVIEVQEDVDINTGIINRSRAYLKCIVINPRSLLMNRPVRLEAFSDALGTVNMLSVFTFYSVSMEHEDLEIFAQCLVRLKHLEELDLCEINCVACSYKRCTCRIEMPFSERLRKLEISQISGHILLGSHPSLKSINLKNVKIMKLGLSNYKQLQDLKLQNITCTTCTQGECCCTVDLRYNEQLEMLYLQGLKGQIMLGPLHSAEIVTLKCIKELAHVLHQLKNSCLRHLELLGVNLHVRDGYQQVELKGVITEVLPTLHSLQTLCLVGIDLDDDDLIISCEMKHLKEVRLGGRGYPVTMTLQCMKRFVDSIIQVQHTITVLMMSVAIRPAQDRPTREAVKYIKDNCHVGEGCIHGLNDGHDEDGEHDTDKWYILMDFENIKRHAPVL